MSKNKEYKIDTLSGFSEECKFYVYVHRDSEQKVFYVGKGHGNRAWVSKSRNNHWNNTVNKHGGFTVELVFNLLNEKQAFDLEKEIISQYGLNTLTNQTLGGHSTTGYRHTYETRKKQSEIAKEKLLANPERFAEINRRIQELISKQGPEFGRAAIKRANETIANYTEEERAEHYRRNKAWMKDPEKLEALAEKLRQFYSTDEGVILKKKSSDRIKELWKDPVFAANKAKSSSEQWNNPEFRKKLLASHSKKLVVNRVRLFDSIRDFEDQFNNGTLVSLQLKKVVESGYIGYMYKGMLLEYYNPEIHTNVAYSAEITRIEHFENQASNSVKADNMLFFRLIHMAKFLGAKNPSTTAEWISKKAKNNEFAFGYNLSFATIDEVNAEIVRRVELHNKEKTSE